jgi:hypothetical protein
VQEDKEIQLAVLRTAEALATDCPANAVSLVLFQDVHAGAGSSSLSLPSPPTRGDAFPSCAVVTYPGIERTLSKRKCFLPIALCDALSLALALVQARFASDMGVQSIYTIVAKAGTDKEIQLQGLRMVFTVRGLA